jgi:membrane-anchored glycerophosphoryl diester phosphodiesterase (GDPDase)
MSEHAEALDWAASWFRFFFRLNMALVIIAVVLLAIIILFVPSVYRFQNTFVNKGDLIGQGIGAIIGGLIVAFLWRTGYIILSFLADFARGLQSQQIARERRMQQPDNS